MPQLHHLALWILLAPLGDPPPRERIEWVELSAAADAGAVGTAPEFLESAASRTYLFGRGPCRRPLAKPTLDALVDAMRTGAFVRIEADAVGSGDEVVRCIRAVRFYPRSSSGPAP